MRKPGEEDHIYPDLYDKLDMQNNEEMIPGSPDPNPSAAAAPEENGGQDMTEIIGVQFRPSGKIYYFDPAGLEIPEGTPVIVETTRGLEYGVCRASNHKVKSYLIIPPLRKTLRVATEADTQRRQYNEEKEKEAFDVCLRQIEALKLDMKLIEVEYTFDNSKLLFYFTADGRVDFRELVKDLASVFRTRIEMRQVGIRDEAKLLGGLGVCGRPFCCSTFLADFGQVSIHMAKEQNLSLNSTKISGSCGRLMCCLRFEYETYAEALSKLPPLESRVITPDGPGTVAEISALAGLIKVHLDPQEENAFKVYPAENVSSDPDHEFVRPAPPDDMPQPADRPSYRSFTDDRSVLPDRQRGDRPFGFRAERGESRPYSPRGQKAPEPAETAPPPAPDDSPLEGIDYSNYDESINDAPLPDAPPDDYRDRTPFRPKRRDFDKRLDRPYYRRRYDRGDAQPPKNCGDGKTE